MIVLYLLIAGVLIAWVVQRYSFIHDAKEDLRRMEQADTVKECTCGKRTIRKSKENI